MGKTSWEIIKDKIVMGQANTFGGHRQLLFASDLFIELLPVLTDGDAATKVWSNDPELPVALANRESIKTMAEAGVIRGGIA